VDDYRVKSLLSLAKQKPEKRAASLYDRCNGNFELFGREGVTIPDKYGAPVPFIMREEQRDLWNHIKSCADQGVEFRIIILKPRQIGFSTFIAVLYVYLMIYQKLNVILITQDSDSLSRLWEIYEFIVDNMNPELTQRITFSKRSRQDGWALRGGGSLRINIAGQTEASATKKGRSQSNQLAHFSEVAFWSHPRITLRGARQSIHLKREPGVFSGIIWESTPNGRQGAFYDAYMKAKNRTPKEIEMGRGYTPWFVPWHEHKPYWVKPTAEQRRLWRLWRETRRTEFRVEGGFEEDDDDQIDRYGLTCEQWLGWGKLLDNNDGDIETTRQEYPPDDVTCFLMSGTQVFTSPYLQHIREAICDPHRMQLRRVRGKVQLVPDSQGDWRLYESFDPAERYCMTADIASGQKSKDHDRAWIGIWRMRGSKLYLSAVWSGQEDPDVIADFMYEIGQLYGWPIAAPELNRAYGQLTVKRLLQRGYPKIYFQPVVNSATGRIARDRPGWLTDELTRRDMFSTLKAKLRRRMLVFRDHDLLLEFEGIIRNTTNGKEEAGPGGFDDGVMMAGIAACVVDDGDIDSGLNDMDGALQAKYRSPWDFASSYDDDAGEAESKSLSESWESMGLW